MLRIRSSVDSIEMGSAASTISTRIRDNVGNTTLRSSYNEILRQGGSVEIINKIGLNDTDSMRPTFDAHSSKNCTKIVRYRKNVSWSSVIQMKDIKSNTHPNKNKARENLSVPETSGYHQHLKGAEKNKKIRRREYHKHQPILKLQTIVGPAPFLSKVDHSSTPSVTQMKDIKSNIHSDNNIAREKISVAEIAGCPLYLKAAERNKRIIRRGRHTQQLGSRLRTITRPLSLLSKVGHSFTPSVVQMKEMKSTVHPGNKIERKNLSDSEIDGSRPHVIFAERNEMLALLRKESHKHQPRSRLHTITRPLSLLSKLDNSFPRSAIQMKDIKSTVHPGTRLHVIAAERNKRLALLRKKSYKHQPRSNLYTITRPASLLSNKDCSPSTSVIETKDIKYTNPDNKIARKKLSASETTEYRLRLKTVERNRRLALLKKKSYTHQPSSNNLHNIARQPSSNLHTILLSNADRSSTSGIIQMKDIKYTIHPDNNKAQKKLSVSEIAGSRLHSKAVERNKRLALLRKEYNKDQPKLNLQTIARPLSLLPKAHRSPTPGMIQMNDIKPTVHPDNNKGRGRLSVSEIAGCRLHLKSMERNKRLALLRKEKNQSKLNLQTIARPLSLMSKIDHNSTPSYTRLYKQAELNRRKSEGLTSNGTDIFNISSCCGWNGDRPFQRLYALSKSMQEDGRKRRKSIAEASEKAKEVWTHPTEKISIADSTRLYYIGMRKYIALEQRIIETSEPGVYKTRLILPLQSC